MARWLRVDRLPLGRRFSASGGAGAGRSEKEHSIALRAVKVLDNKKMLGEAAVHVHAVAVDGFPDMESRNPFWTRTFVFPNVNDGEFLPIDNEFGVQLYRGRPRDFINLYLLVVRSKQASREFAELLKQNMAAKGLGVLAGAAVSISAGLPGMASAALVRELTEQAMNITLDYFRNQKDAVIGVYYGSLTREKQYGAGLRPPDYHRGMIQCGRAAQIAYEVCEIQP